MARIRRVHGNVETPLTSAWRCAALPPGRAGHPSELDASGANWFDARVPGTAASALAAASAWHLDAPRDFDAEDWWFRCRLTGIERDEGEATVLRLGGLATLADVWLDGAHVLRSDNMFLEHEIDVSGKLGDSSELVVRFGSLAHELKKKRPRPKWRTGVVGQQQLRWVRTTLLGRIPAWSPPVAPVGPYREVSLSRRRYVARVAADVRSHVRGRDGVVEAELHLVPTPGIRLGRVSLRVGDVRVELAAETAAGGGIVARGALSVPDVSLWWPFSHGAQPLYDVAASVVTDAGDVAIDLGRTGFRTLELDRSGGGFALRVNGVDVFCRGACWTPLDVVGLAASAEETRAAIAAARAAGMNMLRIGGTMLYETPTFYDLCDELGVLVWHDFMFANMDYPVADPAFAASASAEAAQVVDRLQLSPSLALLCGGSEVHQQAAMLGLAERDWYSPLFQEILPGIGQRARPDVPYCPSTPDGGALPFRVDEGVSHYYGVGAYLRPLEDARRARVRFTAECLAFANIPCDETLESLLGDGEMPTNHPRWKARVPRDKGTGWDFDDVRDHYVRLLFGLDPSHLRRTDPARYLEIGRVVTGETMLAALSEWRRAGSECRGALVWLLRDLWTGAGWGVIDALGRPKAAYYFLKRAFAPVALLATDEGLNGLSLHAVNDGPHPIDAEVRVVLYRLGELPVADGSTRIAMRPHTVTEITADAVLGRFVDTTFAYRFGPANHDLVVANLVDATSGARVGQAFHFPCGYPRQRHSDLGVEAFADAIAPGAWRVTVRTRKFAQAVAIDARGYVADDDRFHLEPSGEHVVTLRSTGARGSVAPLSARVSPLNATAPTKIVVRTPA